MRAQRKTSIARSSRLVREIARAAQERAGFQDWKAGRKQDEAEHLDFWFGAAMALKATGHPAAEAVLIVVAMVISPRGLAALDKLAHVGEATAAEEAEEEFKEI